MKASAHNMTQSGWWGFAASHTDLRLLMTLMVIGSLGFGRVHDSASHFLTPKRIL